MLLKLHAPCSMLHALTLCLAPYALCLAANLQQYSWLPALIACKQHADFVPGEITVQAWGFHHISLRVKGLLII
jgi:hypothetical protein